MNILVAGATSKTGLRFVSLTNDDSTGNILFGNEVDPKGSATRGDVAFVLANAVDDPEWADKTSLMQSVEG